MHEAADEIERRTLIPFLHIADATAEHIKIHAEAPVECALAAD
jgi:aspartate/glutamate racemase